MITLVTGVNAGETVFLNGITMNDMGEIAHVLNNSSGRCVVGAFDKNLHEGYIWTVNRAILSFTLHKSICI